MLSFLSILFFSPNIYSVFSVKASLSTGGGWQSVRLEQPFDEDNIYIEFDVHTAVVRNSLNMVIYFLINLLFSHSRV